MYLKKIHIENFRLLKKIDIELDTALTLVVGKNNTGKTSTAQLIRLVLSERKSLAFDDYPLEARTKLYDVIEQVWTGNLEISEIKDQIKETKITFYIDYADDDDDAPLGELGNFIIDMDEKQTTAQIDAVYAFDFLKAAALLSDCHKKYTELITSEPSDSPEEAGRILDHKIIAAIVKDQFAKFFSLKVFAVNPNDPTDFQERASSSLAKVFTYKMIDAERNLDETEDKNAHPLSSIMNRVFNQNEEQLSEEFQPVIDELNQYVNKINFSAQERINSLMDSIVGKMVYFGYPTAEDLQLKAKTDISLKQQILNSTDLTYISSDTDESLPSTHNGLGYKNLIKMTFILHDFAREIISHAAAIPLLLIEEPEAHMHPQLQTAFISFLTEFLSQTVGKHRVVQIIISTHSSHIANTVNFKQVRYMRRKKDYVECKDLQDFYNAAQTHDEEKENLEFLQKYLKLSYCDLYFCDKAILVEGASERLLLPRMIQKCNEAGDFGTVQPTLASQYYTIVEVGGAYAHRFYSFVDFLGIPTLIITDIDFAKARNEKCQRSEATHSSNGAIARWCRDKYNIALSRPVQIDTVLQLAVDTEKKTNGYRHLEFQTEELNAHPRSLEEAIKNANRELFDIGDNVTEIPLFETDPENNSKTTFALMLLTDSKYENFKVPSYIKNGLIWLNNQDKIAETAIADKKLKKQRTIRATEV